MINSTDLQLIIHIIAEIDPIELERLELLICLIDNLAQEELDSSLSNFEYDLLDGNIIVEGIDNAVIELKSLNILSTSTFPGRRERQVTFILNDSAPTEFLWSFEESDIIDNILSEYGMLDYGDLKEVVMKHVF